jgi:hypothetical protein
VTQPGTDPGLRREVPVPAVKHAPLKKNHCCEVTAHVKSSLTMPEVVPVLVLVDWVAQAGSGVV